MRGELNQAQARVWISFSSVIRFKLNAVATTRPIRPKKSYIFSAFSINTFVFFWFFKKKKQKAGVNRAPQMILVCILSLFSFLFSFSLQRSVFIHLFNCHHIPTTMKKDEKQVPFKWKQINLCVSEKWISALLMETHDRIYAIVGART